MKKVKVHSCWYRYNDANVTAVPWDAVVDIAAGRHTSHCPTLLLYARSDYSTQHAGAPTEEGNPGPVEEDLLRPDKRRRVQCSPEPVPTLPAPLTPPMLNPVDRQVSTVPPHRHRARVQPGSESRELPRVPAFPALSPTTPRLGGRL